MKKRGGLSPLHFVFRLNKNKIREIAVTFLRNAACAEWWFLADSRLLRLTNLLFLRLHPLDLEMESTMEVKLIEQTIELDA